MAGEKEEKDDKDDEIVVVTDDPKNLESEMRAEDGNEPDARVKGKKAEAPAEETADDADEDEVDEEEARLGASEETEAEAEAKAKKSDHKSRRQRRKEAENRLRTELKFLESRNDQLERQIQTLAKRQGDSERGSLEREIAQTESTIRKAESVIAEAITNQKGEEAAEATRIRDKLRDDLKELKDRKAAADKEPEEKSDSKTPEVDPRVVANVKNWHDQNKWFDFRRRDTDSKIAGAIDDSLMSEGYDPTDQEYFDEFNRRIAKLLPHRALKKRANGKDEPEDLEDDDEEVEEGVSRKPKPKAKKSAEGGAAPTGGPKFRTGGPGRDLKPNEVYLSRERIEALKEAGAWDDPKLRAKYLKRYRDYDREHGST